MTDITKQCIGCKQFKLLDLFPRDKPTPSGEPKYRGRCKACVAEAQREARSKEPDRFREASKRCHQAHRDERCAQMRQYLQDNWESETVRKAEWVKNNKEKYRTSQHRYRARRYAADDGTVTTELVTALYAQRTCTYCGKDVPREERAIDHIVPISRGGLHTQSNLTMCCRGCNSSKKDRPLDEWLASKISGK